MPNVHLQTLVGEKDKHGVQVGEWAKQESPGHFSCKVCLPSKVLSFEKGKKDLTQHSETAKHRKNYLSFISGSGNNNLKQPSLPGLFSQQSNNENDAKQKASDFENAICLMIGSHGYQHTFVDCLVKLLKKFVTDSEIIKHVKLGVNKAGYIIKHGLGDYFEEQTLNMMKECHSLGASIDESEVNKASQLEVMVTCAGSKTDSQLRDTRHFATLDIEKGDAETITNTFIDAFVEKGVPYQETLISLGTDGCNTMIGCRNGVQQKAKEKVPELQQTGQCNAHNLSNTMQYAVENFDEDMKLVCVNIYQDLGGAKGFGLKKVHEFKSGCKSVGFEAASFKQFVQVRFRSIRNCLGPIIYNFDALVNYYSNLKKPTERQKLLKKYFVDRRYMSKVRMLFVNAATADMSEAIDFFESRNVQVHNAGDKLESILYKQMRKVFDEQEVTELSEDNETLVKKGRLELLKVDVDKAKVLKRKKMFIGVETEKEIRSLGLDPNSKQLALFYDDVEKFHKSAIKRLLKYFKTALESLVMANMSALSPGKHSHILTTRKLKSLVNTYSKVVRNIDPNGMDRVMTEIEDYSVDDDVHEMDRNMRFEDYWKKVDSLMDGTWKRYRILPAFANALSVVFCSNSEVERQFSFMNNIHQNKQRNRLSQETLNATLLIRSGVESSLVRKDCDRCLDSSSTSHCHCSLVDFTGDIRQKCKEANRKYKASLAEAKASKETDSLEMKKKYEEFVEKEGKRKDKFKESLNQRQAFYKDDFTTPIFNRRDNKRKQSEPSKEASSKDKHSKQTSVIAKSNNNAKKK